MRVIVVGGGLMGTAAAYHLGLFAPAVETIVVDQQHPGRATSAGAGILSGATTSATDPHYRALALAADRYHRLLARERGPGDAGYAPVPLMIVAMPGDEAAFRRVSQRLAAAGARVREVSPKDVRRRFPPIGEVVAALMHDDAARVDGRQLEAWFRRHAQALGVQFAVGSVTTLVLRGSRLAGVRLDSATQLSADAVVVAAGAWTSGLLAQTPVTVPIAPQRGQIVHLGAPAALAVDGNTWPIIEGVRGHYLLPWPDGRVVAGASRETGSGYDATLTAAGQSEVLREVLRVAPGLASAPVLEWRVGLRPASADGLPLLGSVAGLEGLFLLSGHGAGGLLLGPYSAKLVVDQLVGRAPEFDLTPFRPDRPFTPS